MKRLILQVRATLPFGADDARLCSGLCNGCSKKLLDYLEAELDDWEQRLALGETPGLHDLSGLIRTSRKVYRVLELNGLVEASTSGDLLLDQSAGSEL